MNKLFVIIAGVAALGLAGCQSTATVKPEAAKTSEAAKQALSEEAKQALTKAEADTKEAKKQNCLWTTAADALKKAQEAAAKGDSNTVSKFSKVASEHALLGIGQKGYPSTK